MHIYLLLYIAIYKYLPHIFVRPIHLLRYYLLFIKTHLPIYHDNDNVYLYLSFSQFLPVNAL